MLNGKVAAVLTRKSVETILAEGGTGIWRLDRNHTRECVFAVCARNAHHPKAEGREAHRTAFLVGKVKDVVPAATNSKRFLIQFSEYARVNVANAWKKGDRNPIRYVASLKELGIDPANLKWEPMPKQNRPQPETAQPMGVGPLTMAQAKQGLALTFGVSPDAIEITVRG
jgi:hypothetical protein